MIDTGGQCLIEWTARKLFGAVCLTGVLQNPSIAPASDAAWLLLLVAESARFRYATQTASHRHKRPLKVLTIKVVTRLVVVHHLASKVASSS